MESGLFFVYLGILELAGPWEFLPAFQPNPQLSKLWATSLCFITQPGTFWVSVALSSFQ